MSEYFNMVSPTYYEQWPSEVQALSFSTASRQLTLDEARALLAADVEFGDCTKRVPAVEEELIGWLDQQVKRFPQGGFVRLGSRSPKDSWSKVATRKRFRCETGAEAWDLLTSTSERVAEDLQLALEEGYRPYLLVREWRDIPEWQEFRCFVMKRKIVGVSQYQYLRHAAFPEIEQHRGSLRWVIDTWWHQAKADFHLETLIVDLWLRHRTVSGVNSWSIKLIEINPFCEYTDPCLFSWQKDLPAWERTDWATADWELRYQPVGQSGGR